MAAAPAVFNFVFGISETPLTQALERRNYSEALQYIDSRYGECLDEGYYRRTPLFIVLSGEQSSHDGREMPVHIQIARRLIERGANPNLRVPVNNGAEFVSPGRSPLECVADYYNQLTNRHKPILSDKKISRSQAISEENHFYATANELTEELVDLAWLILGHGANVNVRDAENKTPLHNTILKSHDLRMAQVLCDNGADINAVDRFGNTPLMALCSPMPWQDDNDDVYGPVISGCDISQGLQYLLRFDNIKINHCGIHGRTALFYAMQSGNFTVAKVLLERGANPSIRGMGPDGR
ncbi:predicted protein [Nematostella vectensis]|uniref:Uncharacterized protein n=1 Tax=Nematostella vectensis TaxID=45351 RepID=A7RPD2_NEMVE|nr:predicted protein [Nematostella vectensis]|eukprot:XP_001638730.1 predicted protein [Nematostella vectensis]